MQKNWLLPSTLILIAFNCFAQNKNNGTIVFSIGPSFPVGKYASKDIMSNSAGLAKTGETASLSFYSKRKKQFGFTVAMQAQRNPLNTKALENGFSQAKFSQFVVFASNGTMPPPPSSYTTYPNWKFDKHAWLAASLLAGCYAEFASHNSSLSFILKGMIGGLYVSSPKLNGKSITDTATASFEQNSKSGIGFTCLLGSGIKYQLSKKLSLYSDLEYAGTNDIKFKKIHGVFFTTHGSPGSPNYSVSQATITADRRQKITNINFRIGMGLRL
jgi:hypothetical protein